MAATMQITFSNVSLKGKLFFLFKYHRSLFLRDQLKTGQHYDNLVPNKWHAITWNNDDQDLWHSGITSPGWIHDDFIKWKHFPHYWPFVRGIHWWPVDSPHKGQWRGALMFTWCVPQQIVEKTVETPVILDTITHYDVTVMINPWSGIVSCKILSAILNRVLWSAKAYQNC